MENSTKGGTAPASPSSASSAHRLGIAWMSFCFALALHVTDEALTGFLSIYNPTVVSLRQKFGLWPMPTFEFRGWLTGLIILVVALRLLSLFMYRNMRWVRLIAYFFAIVAGILNALGHTVATILGHTVSTVSVQLQAFCRPLAVRNKLLCAPAAKKHENDY